MWFASHCWARCSYPPSSNASTEKTTTICRICDHILWRCRSLLEHCTIIDRTNGRISVFVHQDWCHRSSVWLQRSNALARIENNTMTKTGVSTRITTKTMNSYVIIQYINLNLRQFCLKIWCIAFIQKYFVYRLFPLVF